MDTETFFAVYKTLISLAFIVSALNWVGYTVLAPWYKSSWGRVIWTKFLANTLVLLVPFLQFNAVNVPFRREISIIAMLLFIVAIGIVGWYIYTRQLSGYLKYRLHRKHRKEGKKDADIA